MPIQPSRVTLVSLLASALLALAGCGTSPPRSTGNSSAEEAVVERTATLGDEIVMRAIAQVGRPYRYGGADLDGFDCSGLVVFVHRELGLTVPRTAAEQYAASTPVNVRKLEPGDLLFFRMTKRNRVSHVGIYAGNGRFIHAPQSGRRIELRELGDSAYGPNLVGAGRLHADVLDSPL